VQSRQKLDPEAVWNLPIGHVSHADAVTLIVKDPALHTAQSEVRPEIALNLPTPQLLQNDEPSID
jgi:hypothetical protein